MICIRTRNTFVSFTITILLFFHRLNCTGLFCAYDFYFCCFAHTKTTHSTHSLTHGEYWIYSFDFSSLPNSIKCPPLRYASMAANCQNYFYLFISMGFVQHSRNEKRKRIIFFLHRTDEIEANDILPRILKRSPQSSSIRVWTIFLPRLL